MFKSALIGVEGLLELVVAHIRVAQGAKQFGVVAVAYSDIFEVGDNIRDELAPGDEIAKDFERLVGAGFGEALAAEGQDDFRRLTPTQFGRFGWRLAWDPGFLFGFGRF